MYIENVFPSKKLENYQKLVGGNKNKAIALCTLDIVISESLYPALHVFEVTLSDKINQRLVEHSGKNWCFANQIKFESRDAQTEKSIKLKLRKLKNKFQSEDIANSVFISNQNFFYWTNILNPINKHLWEDKNGIGGIKRIFKSSGVINQIMVFQKINKLRRIRNNIAHNKSIINYNLIAQYQNCRKFLGMMSSDALDWCDKNCRFFDVHPDYRIVHNELLSPNLDLDQWMQIREADDK